MKHRTFPDSLRQHLLTHRFGRSVECHDVLDSTNLAARRWAREGAPEGSLVISEYQTQGRGRFDRSWIAAPGLNLTFSLVLRPLLPAEQLGLLSIAASAAVADTLTAYAARDDVAIRWPNDVLLTGKKCCGMLLQADRDPTPGTDALQVVLGVGVNVNQADFPGGLSSTATSLIRHTGLVTNRAQLLADLLLAMERRYFGLVQTGNSQRLRETYESYLYGRGAIMTFRQPGNDETVTGTVAGITKSGWLRLITEQGERTFAAGELTSRAKPATEF